MKYFKLIFITLIFSINNLSAQNWGEIGTIWVYSISSMTSELYFKYTIEKDTMMLGLDAKKASITKIEFIGIPGEPPFRTPDQHIGNVFFRSEGDSIFWLDDNEFKFLYDFSPEINDTWIIESNSNIDCTSDPSFPQIDQYTVTEFSQQTYLDQVLDVINLEGGGDWSYGNEIIIGVGSVIAPFPQLGLNCMGEIESNLGSHWGLACSNLFEISSEFCEELYIPHTTSNSDYIEQDFNNLLIYPNPSYGTIWIEINNQLDNSLSIYDAQGKHVFEKELTGNTFSLPTENWSKGVYFINIANPKYSSTKKIIVK